jgi:hypothetical protein
MTVAPLERVSVRRSLRSTFSVTVRVPARRSSRETFLSLIVPRGTRP